MPEERRYRSSFATAKRPFFRVVVKETDLFVHTRPPLEALTRELILTERGYLENYIARNPEFAATLSPWRTTGPAPRIVRMMAEAGRKAGVGPMAAVAGAVAECVGRELLSRSPEVIVENGGDIFLKTDTPLTLAVFAGKSPLSCRIGLRVDATNTPIGVCTSSGTIGHSLSMGKADAVCAVSPCCALADAAATAIGNRVAGAGDITAALDFGGRIPGVTGIVIIVGDKIGFRGDMEVVPLPAKKA